FEIRGLVRKKKYSQHVIVNELGVDNYGLADSNKNQPNIHSLTERDAQSADCHLFSTLKKCAIIIGGGG
ncbi:hypothetical protein, partial [Prevotella heparinolytica]|uniref:hypothetical protein n=1 Tax=Prevotella heparinolytica TaxID=28113 RepID=UPI001BE106DB